MQVSWKKIVWVGFLLAAPLFLGGANGEGCGTSSVLENLSDDSSKEAKVEKARIEVDEKKYDEAIKTLADLCGTVLTAPTCDPDIVSLYASAHAGRADLDLFALIKEGNLQATSGTGSFTLFSKYFSSPTAADVSDMGGAVALLASIANRTPDRGLQLATVATSDLVIFLGSLTGGYSPTTGKPMTPPLISDITPDAVSRVSADLTLMTQGLSEAGLGSQNISGHIQQIIGPFSGGDPLAIVTFLNNL
ncbi:MAG: hypothetical protein WAO55_00540 [Candidatus Manganitrophaceae bacterium]